MPSKAAQRDIGKVGLLASQLTQKIADQRASGGEALDEVTREHLVKLAESISALLIQSQSGLRPAEITLGRPDGIARFFAFCFVNRAKVPLAELASTRAPGSGVYAIYYHGSVHPAYGPISGSETPIYVGKADPAEPFAETPERQGYSLYGRLQEHVRSINRAADLDLADFQCRSAVVQSGMQAAVEAFMIQLFKPIWNKEIRICYGIGKHGDSANTRRNKRSPWDTMHPGRVWANATTEDQRKREEVVSDIERHFAAHGVIKDTQSLLTRLAV